MKVKDLIMKLIYCDPEAEVRCLTYKSDNERAEAFSLDIRSLENYEDGVDLVLDNLDIIRIDDNETFDNLRNKVLDWGKSKDLLHYENAEKQFMKFIEEVFEFKTELDVYRLFGYVYLNFKNMKTEIGDVFVTLIILCEQLGITPAECLELAYNKISKRKGKTINGIFVKEEDLKEVEE